MRGRVSSVFSSGSKRGNTMNDPGFWSIYCPILAALISSVLFCEGVRIGLEYYFHRREVKRVKKIREKLASGEISMEDLDQMFPGPMMGPGMEIPFDVPPAASGTEPRPPGQYV
jgi:hypothetical protein